MLSKSGFKPILALVVLILAALACAPGGEDPTATPEPAPTDVPAVPTEEPTAVPTEEPEPTATADPTAGFESFTSEEMGITLSYPADWAIEDFFFINLASDPALLEDTDGMTEGAVMLAFSSPSSDYDSTDPLVIASQQAEEFAAGEEATSIGDPEALTINGQDAAKVRVTGEADDGTPLVVTIYTIVNGDRVATIISATPETSEAEYGPVLEAIAGTVEVFEPTVVEEDPPVVVDPTEDLVEVRQWPSSATASSEYGSDSWSAAQATGERDTFECGDISTAWASETSDGIDTLELNYDIPVIPTSVIIAQTYSPNQVVLVEIRDVDGTYHELYSGEPEIEDCPFIMALTVDADYLADGVRITVDQSVLGASWNEIDAVELVGLGAGEVSETPPTTEEPAGDIPAGFLWRVGGESGVFEGELSALGGLAIDDTGKVYVADNIHGIYVYDTNGNYLNVYDDSSFNSTTDIKMAPDGNLVVADWGANTIFIVSPDGTVLNSFGGEGTDPGLFGTFSPGAVAVGPDGRIYAHDDNEDAAGEDYERIQIFDADGNFLSAFNIEEDFFSLSGMAFGPDGNLYMVGFIGDGVMKYSPEGEFLALLGEDAIGFTGPQGIFVDDNGFMYISTWDEDPIIKLDPEGNLVGTFGIEITDNETAWIEGGFYQPRPGGITGLGDGSVIIVTDWSGGFAFITAFTFVE